MSFLTVLFFAACGLASPDLLIADDLEDDRKAFGRLQAFGTAVPARNGF